MEFCCNACTLGGVPFGHLSLRDQISATKHAGFTYIGFDIKAIDAFFRDGGCTRDIKEMLDAVQLQAYEIHPLRCGIGLHNVVSEIERTAAIGDELGITWVCATATGAGPDDAELIEQLQTCADALGRVNIGLGIEFQPWLSIHSPRTAKQVIRNVARPNIGAVVDPFHFFRGVNDFDELALLTAREIAFVQFCDGGTPVGSAFEDMGHRRLPGTGVFDLQRFSKVLRQSGFNGVVECEVQSEELRQHPADFIAARVMSTSRSYW